MRIAEYLSPRGHSPFSDWFNDLDATAAARITSVLVRIGNGNRSGMKSVGQGVYEWRIDTGPGYRIYFGRDGDEIVVLLGGGAKRRQQRDIEAAHRCWADYKERRSLR